MGEVDTSETPHQEPLKTVPGRNPSRVPECDASKRLAQPASAATCDGMDGLWDRREN